MATRPWADKPFPLIESPSGPSVQNISPQTLEVATEMCLVHNILIRNLNAIYLQAPNLTTPTDMNDFMLFCRFWHETISHHHDMEEKYFFNWIEEYTGEDGLMQGNLAQHEAFHDGLEAFGAFAREWKEGGEWDGGKEVLRLVDGFAGPLNLHLKEEIGSLVALERFGGEMIMKTWRRFDKQVVSETTDKSKVIPMALGGVDRTVAGGKHKDFPAFPWFVPYIVKWFFMGKYQGAWRFSPCTVFGEPRELPFVKLESE